MLFDRIRALLHTKGIRLFFLQELRQIRKTARQLVSLRNARIGAVILRTPFNQHVITDNFDFSFHFFLLLAASLQQHHGARRKDKGESQTFFAFHGLPPAFCS